MSQSPAATAALGEAIAPLLAPGDVVLLRGELGAGKTTLVRAVARALGVREPVTSPTFTLVQRYPGRPPVAHVDGYRLAGAGDEDLELIHDAVGEDCVAFVEWPDALLEGLPEPRLAIELRHEGGDRRLVVLDAAESGLNARLRQIVAHLRSGHRDSEPEPGAGRRG